jgi:uncharacterized protein YcaQ
MSSSTQTLSARQARRIALAAQGFTMRRPAAAVSGRHLRAIIDRLGVLQIDSVNVLQRAHYLPIFSRIGAYDTALLDRSANRRPRYIFEYWAHMASFAPVALQPALRWRMAAAHKQAWAGVRHVAEQRPELVDWVRREVEDRGPLTADQIEDDVPRRSDNWGWNWSDVKAVLEWLFYCGEVTAAGRTGAFARRYDIPDRVLPAAVVNAPTPSPEDAYRELVAVAAQALGVATVSDLRDYYRMGVAETRPAVADLVDAGVLLPVQVDGWKQPAYLHRDAAVPRKVSASTLVSPFDPLIWYRDRTQRLFDFHYRIEIYVPAAKRIHGYYVLPFLHDERLAARVDLKADRAASVLRIPAVWHVPGAAADTVEALAGHLRQVADWLSLARIGQPERGDLAKPLAKALKAR